VKQGTWEPNTYANYGIFLPRIKIGSPESLCQRRELGNLTPMPSMAFSVPRIKIDLLHSLCQRRVDWDPIALGSWEINHMLLVGYLEID
jgi:hypothetical protein